MDIPVLSSEEIDEYFTSNSLFPDMQLWDEISPIPNMDLQAEQRDLKTPDIEDYLSLQDAAEQAVEYDIDSFFRELREKELDKWLDSTLDTIVEEEKIQVYQPVTSPISEASIDTDFVLYCGPCNIGYKHCPQCGKGLQESTSGAEKKVTCGNCQCPVGYCTRCGGFML